jgi:hypothetical protein
VYVIITVNTTMVGRLFLYANVKLGSNKYLQLVLQAAQIVLSPGFYNRGGDTFWNGSIIYIIINYVI